MVRLRLKQYVRPVLYSALHSIALTFFTYVWMQQQWQFDDELIVARQPGGQLYGFE
jgi:hypothetical protein